MHDQPRLPYPSIASPFFSGGHKTMEVIGEGTVSAAPNKAIIVLGVISESISLTEAQKENASSVTHIIEALLRLSVPKEHIQTTQYSIDIQYNYEDGKQLFRGYKVTHLLQITNDHIDMTGSIVDTAVKYGANTVSSIQFTMANPEIAYNHALSIAIKNSLLKATTIARTLGVTVHPTPCLVQELSRMQGPTPYHAAPLYAKSEGTPIQPGELQISASIKANFIYYS
ncbi:SIMPL domain-containing protein [Paenibacillus hexagrammi]|uniref:SIMPL domain-containing protein n=1 Tax=Paenibacillus hexagrammi TaxID=2908839 RepID=A0ABY3SLP4_9BACL|nr:SIMPL domain-containing protein [Paenibacillus sp. YPD9-1]UJF34803.1 SIMPL domain-containing protein [Paenibacillus sp. YPD9-1]